MNRTMHPAAVSILLVDDRPDNLLSLEVVLADQNYTLIRASSGNEALRLTLRENLALVLMDVQMPEMDGFETAELMRANPKTRDIPIIFITAGLKELRYQFKGYDVGAVDYLSKPIEPLVLQSKVRIFAELYRQRRELELHKHHLEELVEQRTAELEISNEQLNDRNNELIKNETLYRTLFEKATDGIFHLSADLTLTTVNESFARMHGHTVDEMKNMRLQDLDTPETSRLIPERIAQLMSGATMKFEVEHFHKDGHIFPLEATSSLVSIGDKKFIQSFHRDITERKRNERLLAQEKERLSVTLRSIGDGVITTDISGNIIMLNTAAEAMTGWRSEEAAGRPAPEVFSILSELTRVPCCNPAEKILAAGNPLDLDEHIVMVSKNGKETPISVSGAPMLDNENRITGVVIIIRDMAETQKLTDSMQRAQKLEFIGMLAGGIAHDFNNMLAGIFGYLELAKDKAAANRFDLVPKYLNRALDVFERARGLTLQLLTFAKGGTPNRKTIKIAPIVRHSATFSLSGSNVTAEFHIADDLRGCACDDNQIGQVIDNIVINAKQAMPEGGKIIVRGENVADQPEHPGNFVRISIQDQGIGMPKDVLDKIFDPFFSTKETGHGLGLPTVQSIINQHGGWIEVESALGFGTTFHIYIPASPLKYSEGKENNAIEHQGSGPVLVMDDKEYIQETAGEMLQDMGYSIEQAKNGQEALFLFREAEESGKPFVASLLDLTIPDGMGGKETAAQMRKINPACVVIASSGYSEDPVMLNPEAHDFDGRIIKPYRKKELAELMERVMEMRVGNLKIKRNYSAFF